MNNKTSDKNVANIEDDVKILDKFCEYESSVVLIDGALIEVQDAIQNILAEREQDKKRIQELEEERQLVGMPVKNKRDGRIGVVLHQWKNGSVAVLENINPRVINTHDSWNTLEIISDEVEQNQTKENSIPKQVVIDLIENETINISGFECIAVEDLQELLEGRNENG